MDRKVSKTLKKPHFIGGIEHQAREIVYRSIPSMDARELYKDIRKTAALLAVGKLAKVVRLTTGRNAIHCGPFPLDGFHVVETVLVESTDGNGGITISRPAYYKKANA